MADPFAPPLLFPFPVDDVTSGRDPGPFDLEPPYVEPRELTEAADAESRRRRALPPVVGPTGMPQRRRVVPGYFAAPGLEAAGEVFSMPIEGVVAADEAMRSAARAGGERAAGILGASENEQKQWGDAASLGYDVGAMIVDPFAAAGKGALAAAPFAMGSIRKVGQAVERGPVLYSRLLELADSKAFKSLPWSKGPEAVYSQLSAMARKGKLSQQEVDHVFQYVDPAGELSPDTLRELIEDQGAIVNRNVYASPKILKGSVTPETWPKFLESDPDNAERVAEAYASAIRGRRSSPEIYERAQEAYDAKIENAGGEQYLMDLFDEHHQDYDHDNSETLLEDFVAWEQALKREYVESRVEGYLDEEELRAFQEAMSGEWSEEAREMIPDIIIGMAGDNGFRFGTPAGTPAGDPTWNSNVFSKKSAAEGTYQERALQHATRYRDIPRTDAVDKMLESLTFKASKGRAGQYEVRDDKGRLLGHVVARTKYEARELLGKAAGTRAATHARAQQGGYSGGHVRLIDNVLHERMDRRPIDVGEGQGEDALFVQEVQSDWNRDATPPSGTHEFAAPSKRGDEGYEFEFDYADRMAAHESGVDVVGAQKKAILEPAAKRIRMAWGMPGNGRVNLSDVQMPEQNRLDAIQRIYDYEYSHMTLDEMLGDQDAEFARAVLDGILADAEEFGLSTDVMRDLNPNDLEVLTGAVGEELAEARFNDLKRQAVRLANDPDSIGTRDYEDVMSYVLGPEAIERDLDRIGSVQYVDAGLPPMRVFPEEVDLIPSMPWRDGAWIDLAARDILLTAALQDEKYIAVATQAMQDATPGIAYTGDLYKSGDGRLQGALRRVVRQIDPDAVVNQRGGSFPLHDPINVQSSPWKMEDVGSLFPWREPGERKALATPDYVLTKITKNGEPAPLSTLEDTRAPAAIFDRKTGEVLREFSSFEKGKKWLAEHAGNLSVKATIKMTPKLKEYLLKYGLPAAALAGMTQAPGAEQFAMPEDGPFVAPQ